jgi:hypothetical protein
VVHRTVNSACPVCTELSGGTPGSLRERPTTRHSRAIASDYPVCTRQSINCRIQWSTATDQNGRRTIWCAPDYLVGHRAVCAERPTTRCSWAVTPDYPVCTEQFSNGRIQLSTATDPNGRRTWQGTEQLTVHVRWVPDCPVRSLIESCCFLSNSYNCGGGYKYPPTGHFNVWEPKQHTKAYYRHFQVLIRPIF